MAGWFFKRRSTSGNHEKNISLQAGNPYTPTQVSGDTIEHPSTATLPTLGKLLTVQKGEKFHLPNNELIVWLLVERDNEQLTNGNSDISETSSGYSGDIDTEQPCWGFIPKKCLTDESKNTIENSCSQCGKYEQVDLLLFWFKFDSFIKFCFECSFNG